MRRLLLGSLGFAYYAAASFFFAGFVVMPWRLPATAGGFAALSIASLSVFAAPLVLRWSVRRIGVQNVVLSLLPLVMLTTLAYLGRAALYYQGQLHLFDPYLQNPPELLPEPRAEAAARDFRVLAMGGSTTQNWDMPEATRYPRVLERLLNDEHPALATTVLNAGRDWWTTRHSLIHYTSYAHEWRPDVVVVMHAINDVYRSFSPRDFAIGGYNELYSHFYGPAITGARLVWFPEYLYLRFGRGFGNDWYPASRFVEVDLPIERYVSLPRFERNLESLIHYVKADGAELVLLTEPTLLQPEMSAEELAVLKFGRLFCVTHVNRWRSEHASPRSLAAAMNAFNDVIRRLAREHRVTLVDLANTLPATLDYFRDDVHYTEKGAAAVARHVADAVGAQAARQETLLSSPPTDR